MKKITLLLICFITLQTKAQVNIGANTAPNTDAMVEISGSTKGLLLPRIALTSTSSFAPLSAHVAGMAIYNTATAGAGATAVSPGYYYNTGTAWIKIAGVASGTSWLTGGNTNGAISNLGTNDNFDLPFVTKNIERMRILNTGLVGIGTTTPAAQLDVAYGVTNQNTVINGTGSVNDFLQYNIQNTSTGTHAQSGYAATADNGTPLTGFVWMGINNSAFNYPTYYNIGGANDVSFLGSGQDMYVANANYTKSIIFSTGKATSPYFNERMRLTSDGNFGIGTSTPAAKLDVAASTTTVNNIINATGSINDYLEYNIQNTSTGTKAQSGYNATADNGTATTGFVWMGINNSAFNNPQPWNIGGVNDVSFLGSGADMYVANSNNTKSIIFSTGKATTPYFNERMRITNGGNVGIGTATPINKLTLYHTSNTDGLIIQNTTGGLGSTSNIYMATYADFVSGTLRAGSKISAIDDNAYSAHLTFSTKNPGADANALNERMRITSGGFVGIGTTAPTALLHLNQGHIRSQQTTAPTIVVTTANGITADAIAANSTDMKGTITTTGTNTGTNTVLTITFNGTFTVAPIVIITPANANTQACTYFVTSTTTTFVLNFSAGAANPSFNYMVIE